MVHRAFPVGENTLWRKGQANVFVPVGHRGGSLSWLQTGQQNGDGWDGRAHRYSSRQTPFSRNTQCEALTTTPAQSWERWLHFALHSVCTLLDSSYSKSYRSFSLDAPTL